MEIIRARYRYGQAKKRPRRPKRLLLWLMTAVLLLAGSGYGVLAFSKPIPAVAAESIVIEMPAPAAVTDIAWPTVGQAAIGSLEDGVLAVSPAAESRRPIASITKVITALAVVEKQPLEAGQSGPVYTISQADINSYHRYVSVGGSVMPVNFGQQITLKDALAGMMLPSGNNMADSLVAWVFGSMEAYLTYANDMLSRYGLENTVVADASGFHAGSQSTPSDLIRLGQRLLRHPVLSEIVATRQMVIPGTGEVRNTNLLLADEDAVGIKTGTTDEAGNCLLFAVKHGPDKAHTMIGVVMGQRGYGSLFSAVRSLRDSALKSFRQVEVLPAGTVVGRLTADWGQQTDVIVVHPLRTYGWAGKAYEAEILFEQTEAPVLESQIVGRAQVAGDANEQVQLVARTALVRPSRLWRLANYW